MKAFGGPVLVLHADLDSFFCQVSIASVLGAFRRGCDRYVTHNRLLQVELQRNPQLKGIPFCVQQHQDIIACNYAARAAGCKKHMRPADARAAVQKVGGTLVHVHMEEGGRISYEPYRSAGRAFIKTLKTLDWCAHGLQLTSCC